MEIKQLEQEHLDAMNKELYATEHQWFEMGCVVKDADKAAILCSSITLLHMADFLHYVTFDWKMVYRKEPMGELWMWGGNEEHAAKLGLKTTEQLIQLYFDSLNK